MKVDFWQLSRDPVEKVVALIAVRVRSEGGRLLVVSQDAAQREAIGKALWAHGGEAFLANGRADEPHAERQPILLSSDCAAPNGAAHIVFADGEWRGDAAGFERRFLLFREARVEAARACWRGLDGTQGLERSFFRQDAGKWTKVA